MTRQTEDEISAFVANGDGKSYPVTLTAVRSFCGCNNSLFRGKTCKHSVALALYVIRNPETKWATEMPAPNLNLAKGAHSRGFGPILKRGVATLVDTKNGDRRLVPLPSEVVMTLQQRPVPIREWVPGWNLGRLTHAFVALVRKTELAGTGVSFHTLRHTFASHAVMNGVDLFTVGKLLGHKTIQQTQRYAHLAPDHMRSAVEQTARAVFAPDVPREVPHEAVSAA